MRYDCCSDTISPFISFPMNLDPYPFVLDHHTACRLSIVPTDWSFVDLRMSTGCCCVAMLNDSGMTSKVCTSLHFESVLNLRMSASRTRNFLLKSFDDDYDNLPSKSACFGTNMCHFWNTASQLQLREWNKIVFAAQ